MEKKLITNTGSLNATTALLTAIHFAAEKHRNQRRKDVESTPYINHPIAVAQALAVIGGVEDLELLVAAVLHDTVEDTDTTFEELAARFGTAVRELVAEVTDDESLEKAEQKRLQVESAPHKSLKAKQLKLADKICNIRSITADAPTSWSLKRKLGYLDWAEAVIAGCRGVNEPLEQAFDDALEIKRTELGAINQSG